MQLFFSQTILGQAAKRLWPVLWMIAAAMPAGQLAAQQQITVAGSTTLQPVISRIAREYMKDNPGSAITVSGGGSGAGLAALLTGEVEIASSSRFISTGELDRASEAGIYPVPFRIADDCIVPVVHKSNRLKDLSLVDLKRIYRGEIVNWQELGGADRPIEVISRSGESGTYGVWHTMVMERDEITARAVRVASSAEVVRAVSVRAGAVGYISLGHLSASVKPLRVDGVMGSLNTVRNGRYALSRPLFMFTRGWPEGVTLQFINYALNPDRGQAIARKMGFIPAYARNR